MKIKVKFFSLVFLWFLLLLLTACGNSATPTAPAATPTPAVLPATTSATSRASTATAAPTATTLPSPTATPLPAKVIAIDPGHGGIDWGAFHTNSAGKIDLKEKDVTLQIALLTAELLRTNGFKVVLTRTEDALANNPPRDLNGDGKVDQVDDQEARINVANENKADLFLSIHLNSSDAKNTVKGVETIYCDARPFSDKSKQFALLLQQNTLDSFNSIGYDPVNRGAIPDSVLPGDPNDHILVLGPDGRYHAGASAMPGGLTEALFVSNDVEAALLANPKTLEVLAKGYTKSVKEFFSPS